MLKKIAPELFKPVGKASILFIYFVFTFVAIYGTYNLEYEFNMSNYT